MGSWYRNCVRSSYKYGKCPRLEGGRGYVPMSRVRLPPVNTSYLTMFGPWKRIESMLQPWGQQCTTSPTIPCVPLAAIIITGEHITS